MKTKLDQKKAISTATLGVSAAGGALVSKGVMSIAPASLNKPIPKVVFAVIALIAASTIQGQGTLEKFAKGSLLGVGIQQGTEGALSYVNKPVLGENPTTAEKFISGALAGVDGATETFVLPHASTQRRIVQPQNQGINVI